MSGTISNEPTSPAGPHATHKGELERRKSCIINKVCSIFVIQDNPSAESAEPWYEISSLSSVAKYDAQISASAKKFDVDPDVVRAIMYMETTHGYYDFALNWIGENKSILPMNMNVDFWGKTFGSRSDLENPTKNIDAGTDLLMRIDACLPPQRPVAHIASIYNNLGATKVSAYGARVSAIYDHKPWIEKK